MTPPVIEITREGYTTLPVVVDVFTASRWPGNTRVSTEPLPATWRKDIPEGRTPPVPAAPQPIGGVV
jgi:hypothetical protein